MHTRLVIDTFAKKYFNFLLWTSQGTPLVAYLGVIIIMIVIMIIIIIVIIIISSIVIVIVCVFIFANFFLHNLSLLITMLIQTVLIFKSGCDCRKCVDLQCTSSSISDCASNFFVSADIRTLQCLFMSSNSMLNFSRRAQTSFFKASHANRILFSFSRRISNFLRLSEFAWVIKSIFSVCSTGSQASILEEISYCAFLSIFMVSCNSASDIDFAFI